MSKEYQQKWAKKYYAIPKNREKRRLASAKWKTENPNYFKTESRRIKNRKSAVRWYYQNKEKSKENSRKRKLVKVFGISSETYNALFDSQNGLCAICGKSSTKRLAVDHNHTTGKVRGLLCHRCNTSLGLLDEDLNSIKKMLEYLEKFK
jgi:hypothetical protein